MSQPGARVARRKRSRAQAMVEFALVAPIFFLLLFGIIDFGRYVYYVQILNNAAREGARYAIVHGGNSLAPSGPAAPGTVTVDPTGANVVNVVKNYAVGAIQSSAVMTVTPTWWQSTSNPDPAAVTGDGSNAREDLVQVIVTYHFTPAIPLVPLPPITVMGSAVLVINN
jgi:Flp pilus assembly protein TadG